jgi:hypothetical protein
MPIAVPFVRARNRSDRASGVAEQARVADAVRVGRPAVIETEVDLREELNATPAALLVSNVAEPEPDVIPLELARPAGRARGAFIRPKIAAAARRLVPPKAPVLRLDEQPKVAARQNDPPRLHSRLGAIFRRERHVLSARCGGSADDPRYQQQRGHYENRLDPCLAHPGQVSDDLADDLK